MITASVSAAILWYYVNNQRYVSNKSITLTLFLSYSLSKSAFIFVFFFYFQYSLILLLYDKEEQTIRL